MDLPALPGAGADAAPPPAERPPRALLPLAVTCLFFSGAAGLVYQVVWSRYLALFLGHTSYAIVAVLVAFMGGLALGNAWLGRWADRVRRPLAFYAWLEIGIAVFALVFPSYNEAIRNLFLVLARGLEPGGVPMFALKFLCSLASILLPTVLMGGTLPVITRLITRSLGELRGRVATLYGVNSAGAVAGCFLADFWWIPAIGLESTVLAGAALNLLVGGVALAASARWREAEWIVTSPPPPSPTPSDPPYSPAEIRLAIVGGGISGFAAMLYEVVWTRMLGLALGSSTHAFSIMLITFITGIAAGAWLVSRWHRLRRSLDAFGWSEVALAASLALAIWFYDLVPFFFARLARLLARHQDAFALYQALQAAVCFAVMFVPTLCLGMALPLATRAATADVASTGRSVGTVFAVNTLGTVLGAGLTGLWLLPHLGLARTFALGIAVSGALGILVLRRETLWLRPGPFLAGALAAVALVTWMGGIFNDPWQRAASLALWRETRPPTELATYRQALGTVDLRYYRDGASATVTVDATTMPHGDVLTLRVNGKPDASTSSDVSTQLLLGHLPALLHPAPARALVVGLGSGMTAGALLQHASVEQVDLVEISPEVVEASRLFDPVSRAPLDNPRARLVLEDAKTFLQLTPISYDLILSQPSNPWVAGVAGVYSREYYESCRDRLRPGGLIAQWMQIYEMDNATLDIVLNTFLSVFPHASIWESADSDLILIGTTTPLRPDLDHLRRRFADPAVRVDLERIDLLRLPVLLSREIVPPENTAYLLRPGGRLHSDAYPILEYAAQRAFFALGTADRLAPFDQNQSPRPVSLLGACLQQQPLTADDCRAFTLFRIGNRMPSPRVVRSILLRWCELDPDSLEPAEHLLRTASVGSLAAAEARRWRAHHTQFLAEAAQNPTQLAAYTGVLLQEYREQRSAYYLPSTAEAESALQRLAEVAPSLRRITRLLLAELAWDRGDDASCLRLGAEGLTDTGTPNDPLRLELDPGAPGRVLTRMLETHLRGGRNPEALALCGLAIQAGYVSLENPGRDPLLEMTCRKVLAIAGANPALFISTTAPAQ